MSDNRKIPGVTISYPNRLLRALAEIFESPTASTEDRLQAAKLALEVLPHRVKPRRKTDKEKLVLKALEQNKRAGENLQPKSPDSGKT